MLVLDLFSGIGGFSLGLERAGFQTIAFCEQDEFCQKVLSKHWPDITIHSDIKELDGGQYRKSVDVVCGGFPCQPFSVAGNQDAQKDDRHLWPEMLRVIQGARPSWVICENVVGLKDLALDECISGLEMAGYAVQTFNIPACAIGAHHQRQRLWIIANANSSADGQQHKHETPRIDVQAAHNDVANSKGKHGHKFVQEERIQKQFRGIYRRARRYWASEPAIPRVADGVSNRLDRNKALGNSIVPQIAELIGLTIKASMDNKKPYQN